jgi:PTH1 family peptidyl-tRNA hydrolase
MTKTSDSISSVAAHYPALYLLANLQSSEVMSNAGTRAHVVISPTAASLIHVADSEIEIPQTSTPEDSDDDSDEPTEATDYNSRKRLRKEKARQKLKQLDTIPNVANPAIELPWPPRPYDTDSEAFPKSRKEKRQQKKQRHDSAQPTPTSTDTESSLRKPPNKSKPAPSDVTTIPPVLMAKAAQAAYPLLICSIGNPGASYASTLHSAGHILTSTLSHAKGYKPFTKGLSGLVSQPQGSHMAFGLLGFKRVPTDRDVVEDWTFWQSTSLMNVSGSGVKRAYSEWLRDIRRQASNSTLEGRLVVVHDELESALGKITVRDGGVSAKGHNGIKSCQQQLGGTKWWRVGVGIGRPESRDPNVVSKYVLGKMTSFQKGKLEGCAVPVFKALEDIAAGKK